MCLDLPLDTTETPDLDGPENRPAWRASVHAAGYPADPAAPRTTEIFRHDFARKPNDLWSKDAFSNMDPDERPTADPDLQIYVGN